MLGFLRTIGATTAGWCERTADALNQLNRDWTDTEYGRGYQAALRDHDLLPKDTLL